MLSSVHDLVSESADRAGDRPAVSYRDVTWTYHQLWEHVQRFGRALTAAGLQPGDRVGIYLEKRLETVQAIVGCSAAGLVFVPINHLVKAPQVGYIVGDCGVSLLVTTRDRFEQLRPVLLDADSLRTVVLLDLTTDPEPEAGRSYAVRAWDSFLADTGGPEPRPVIDLDLAAILYTSGSTGKPKGVVLTHRNLVVGADSVSSYLHNTPEDVILAVLPLSFDAGLSQLTTAFRVGAHVVLANYLLARDVVRLCAEHRVTGLTCVPPLWIQLAAADWPTEVAERLRYFANTGGAMPRRLLQTLRSIFSQASPYLMYGLTEAFRSTYLDPAEVDRRPDSIGKAIPNAEILVLRPDGTRCDPGEHGELVHRGALVALGYWNNPEQTAERFKPLPGSVADWRAPELAVFSGDTVTTDEQGFLYFVGRRDEMIKTSGYRVSPSEVEEAAYETALIREAVALGVPDPRLDQRIVLIVSPASEGGLDERGLLTGMRQRLPNYMVPAEVQVRASLPRSPNGKLDRVRLRAELRP